LEPEGQIMSTLDSYEYFNLRVLASQAMAQQAKSLDARAIHLDMADRYRKLAAEAARAICEQPLDSGGAAQSAVEVILVEPGNLHQFHRV
jgi:hypothetical protein